MRVGRPAGLGWRSRIKKLVLQYCFRMSQQDNLCWVYKVVFGALQVEEDRSSPVGEWRY